MWRSVSPSAYKQSPVFPRISSALSLAHSSSHGATRTCTRCFPQVSIPRATDYVDLLEFSAYDGIPWPLAPGVPPPSRWAADLRYTWSRPIPHKYPAVHDRVLQGKRVKEAIENMATAEEPPRKLKAKAGRFFLEIRATLNRLVCRVCGYLLFKVFRRVCSKLLVVPSQMQALKKAEETGIPLVYLPLHQSHLDYLLITWNNWHFGLRLPHIASGDNLNLSGFGWLLRATGAFFIRRRLAPDDEGGRDQLYRTVLHAYIDEILKQKMSLEFFLEGTRNRFGKPLMPKNGLISNVVEAVQQGIIEDCYLVPVAITYDQVTEGVFLNELMGVPKVRENVWMLLKGMLKGFGMLPTGVVRINAGTPVLLSEYLHSISSCLTSSSSSSLALRPPSRLSRLPTSYSYRELLPWNAPSVDVDRALVRGIGLHVVYDAAQLGSVHLVSVVSAVLLCKYRSGGLRQDIEADAEWLANELVRMGYEVVGWEPGRTSGRRAVAYADDFLATVTETEMEKGDREMMRPVATHRCLVRLAYSRNALVPQLALKAAIALTLAPYPVGETVPVEDVLDEALDVCEWLRFECLFCRPCEQLRERLAATLLGTDERGLADPVVGLVERTGVDAAVGELGGVRIRPSGRSRDQLLFFSNLLRPFVQSYALLVGRLLREVGPVKESDLIKSSIRQTLARPNDTDFPLFLEAANSDSLRNGMQMLRERGVVVPSSDIGGGPNIVPSSTDLLEAVNAQLHKMLVIGKAQ